MAKRRKSGAPRWPRRLIALALIIVVLMVAIWFARYRALPSISSVAQHHADSTAPPASGTAKDDAGQPLHLSGKLEITNPARDPQLGVVTPAAVLFRQVEMYQWQEQCDTHGCHYSTAWSTAMVDSHKFRDPAGHENPRVPFMSAKFFAGEVRLAGYVVDPDVLVAELVPVDFPVSAPHLPANLVASFRAHDGVLYAGDDHVHPIVGELRVSYRIIAATEVTLSGVARSGKLVLR